MKVETAKGPSQDALSPEETAALNRHGVFFKKRVLDELRGIDGLEIIDEELGVAFGDTRVIDIVARDPCGKTLLYFIIECKRAHAVEKRWIFFRGNSRRVRAVRAQNSMLGLSSVFVDYKPPDPPVCSEGYEFRKADGRADQDPIFKAAAQLSAGYLGFIDRRRKDFKKAAPGADTILERYVPVLVTTADLIVVQREMKTVSIAAGTIAEPPNGESVDCLVLNHPFPTPEGIGSDLRDQENPGPPNGCWGLQHKESIYVVRASKLSQFMAPSHRNFLRTQAQPPL